jgi:hypothetical protein
MSFKGIEFIEFSIEKLFLLNPKKGTKREGKYR